MKLVTWVAGWGVEAESMRPLAERALPGAQHRFLSAVEQDLGQANAGEVTIGWSLGAWRLLEEGSRGQRRAGKVILLSPFLAFCSERGLGGRFSCTHLRWLKRWLRRDPIAALRDFHQRAGLRRLCPAVAEIRLERGLDLLEKDATEEMIRFAQKLPPNWIAAVGEKDQLLIPEQVCRIIRGCRIIAGAGHDPEELVAAVVHEI